LCLLDKPLARSHLLPAGVYKYLRTGGRSPVAIGGGIVLSTDRQTQTYLLCDDCENMLSRGGETWVVGKLLTMRKTFPLFDLLRQQSPAFESDEATVYVAAENPLIKADKLLHFALGIFWKASVHSWGSTDDSLIALGPDSDRIRVWLRNEGSFPEPIYLMAFVSPPENGPDVCMPFEMGEKDGKFVKGLLYCFRVPGVTFFLNIGKTVDSAIHELSLHNPLRPIVISDTITMTWKQLAFNHYRQNWEKMASGKALDKLRRDRGGSK
jgi:hypothetical protein